MARGTHVKIKTKTKGSFDSTAASLSSTLSRMDPAVIATKTKTIIAYFKRMNSLFNLLFSIYAKDAPHTAIPDVFKAIIDSCPDREDGKSAFSAEPASIQDNYQAFWQAVCRKYGFTEVSSERSDFNTYYTQVIKDVWGTLRGITSGFDKFKKFYDPAIVDADVNADDYTVDVDAEFAWDWMASDDFNNCAISILGFDIRKYYAENKAGRPNIDRILSTLMKTNRQLYHVIVEEPDFDVSGVADSFIKRFTQMRSHPQLNRCQDAFGIIERNAGLLEKNLAKYTKSAKRNGGNAGNALLMFINDIMLNGSMKLKVRNQFNQIVKFASGSISARSTMLKKKGIKPTADQQAFEEKSQMLVDVVQGIIATSNEAEEDDDDSDSDAAAADLD